MVWTPGVQRICCLWLHSVHLQIPPGDHQQIRLRYVALWIPAHSLLLPMWIYLKMYDWFSFCLRVARQSSPLCDESYFLLFPHTDSWCVLFTANTSAQTSSMYRSLSLKKPISVCSWCYEYMCNILLRFISDAIASFFPNECSNAATHKLSPGYIKSRLSSRWETWLDCPNVKLSLERLCNAHRACGLF